VVIDRMRSQITSWEQAHDRRSEFLSCYQLMTENMLSALRSAEFIDPDWVSRLLDHFAGYYFHALEAYDSNNPAAPKVWRQVFDAARHPDMQLIQNLLLGMNAHINYDLTFALVDLLESEWRDLSADQRVRRFHDHCYVNHIIHRTIDSVQDTILEPHEPVFEILDRLLGPVDEWAISTLVAHWREEVWENAVHLMEIEPQERGAAVHHIEVDALRRSSIILRLL